jgi:CHAD domain-containing protein
MKPGKIKEIVEEKAHKIAGLCSQVSDGFSEQAIHGFRVEVKSLKALIRLLSAATGSKPLKLPRKVRQLYQIAGAIREAQLEMKEIVARKMPLPAYLGMLNQNIAREQNNWNNTYSKKPFRKLQERAASIAWHELQVAGFTGYLANEIRSMNKLAKNIIITDARFHRLRSRLKGLYFVAAFVARKWGNGKKHLEYWPNNEVGALTAEMGAYNDRRLMLGRLVAFAQTLEGKNEQQAIGAFCSEVHPALLESKKKAMPRVKEIIITLKGSYGG